MRSATSSNSSSSAATHSTAPPRSANSSRARRSCVAAAGSSPRVGWQATTTTGSSCSSRAATSFWALPPESDVGEVVGRTLDRPCGHPRRGAPGRAGPATSCGRGRGCRRSASCRRGHGRRGPTGCRRCPWPPAGGGAGRLTSSPSTVDRAGLGDGEAGERQLELDLAVAVDAGDTEHLAGADDQRVRSSAARRAGRRSRRRPDRSLVLVRPTGGSSSPTISWARLGARPVAHRGRRADDDPVAQHGDAVGGLDDLAQPVGDQHHRPAVVGEAAGDVEQAVGLGVGEHRRRLVERAAPRDRRRGRAAARGAGARRPTSTPPWPSGRSRSRGGRRAPARSAAACARDVRR